MMLTTKGRYAVIAILEIASSARAEPVTLTEISREQNISLNYLEQLFIKLKKAGLVRAIKGPGGGYLITSPLDEIKISDIIDAVEENLIMTKCSATKTDKTPCVAGKNMQCKTHKLWQGLGDQIRNYFDAVSLADLVHENGKSI